MLELVCLCDKNGIRQSRDVKEQNPTLHGSTSTRLDQSHQAASHWSTLLKAQQLLLAWQGRPLGGTRHRIPSRWMKT